MNFQTAKISDYILKCTSLNHSECNEIIPTLHNWTPHEWYSHSQDNKVSYGDFVVTSNLSANKRLQPYIEQGLNLYARTKMGNYGETFFNTHLRFNKYSIGEGIEEHVDHIHAIFDSRPSGIPVLSMVGCLNDDYEGGVFHLCNTPVDIKTGEFIIFPSVFIYPHYVTPVTAGTRYSWVSWAA
jgi:hypothetical protein